MSDNRYIIMNLKDVKLIAEHLPVFRDTKHIIDRFNNETGADILDIVKSLTNTPICVTCSHECRDSYCESIATNKTGRRLRRLVERADKTDKVIGVLDNTDRANMREVLIGGLMSNPPIFPKIIIDEKDFLLVIDKTIRSLLMHIGKPTCEANNLILDGIMSEIGETYNHNTDSFMTDIVLNFDTPTQALHTYNSTYLRTFKHIDMRIHSSGELHIHIELPKDHSTVFVVAVKRHSTETITL